MEGRHAKDILTPASHGFILKRQLTRAMVRYFSDMCMRVWGGTCSQENVNCLGSYVSRQFFVPKLILTFFYLGLSRIERFFFSFFFKVQ